MLFALVALIVPNAVLAAQPAFLATPMSVRQIGMGGVSMGDAGLDGTDFGGIDVLRAWSNPALLAGQEAPYSLAFNGGSIFGNQQTLFGGGAGWKVVDGWVLGGTVSGYSYSFPKLDLTGNTGVSINRSVIFGGLTSSHRWKVFQVGGTLKGFKSDIAGNVTNDIGYDVGGTIRLIGGEAGSLIDIAGALRNVMNNAGTGPSRGFRRTIAGAERRFGALFSYLPSSRTSRFSVGVEYIEVADREPQISSGLEFWITSNFGVRGGLSRADDAVRYAGGLSVALSGMILDYAADAHPLGLSHRVNMSFAFGSAVTTHALPEAAERIRPPPTPEIPVKLVKPPRLELRVEFSDETRDKILEADETAVLKYWIKNTGAGPASNVTVTMHHTPRGPWLSYSGDRAVGNIRVGKEILHRVLLSAGRDTRHGKCRLHIVVREGQGFDADPAIVSFVTHAFKPPNLRIKVVNVFDGQQGYAFGNANGIIDPGESAEITIRITNVGKGPTRGTKVWALSKNPAVLVLAMNNRETNRVHVGDMKPGESTEVKMAVAVTKRYHGGAKLPCNLKMTDSRPGLDQVLAIPVHVAKASSKVQEFNFVGVSSTVSEAALSDRSVLNIAVADLKPLGDLSSEAIVVSDLLASALVGLGFYNVVERSNVQKILAEQAFQQTGCTEQVCAVKLGRILNAQRVVVGSFGKFEDIYIVSARVIDTENGQIVYADEAVGKSLEDVRGAIRKLAERIAQNLH